MPTSESPDIDNVYAAIDVGNSRDPNLVTIAGGTWPRAKFQGVRASYWVGRLSPAADPSVFFAARAHHLERWSVARSSYPEGRFGYHRWKRDARAAARNAIGDVLGSCGLDGAMIERVGELVDRQSLGSDPDTQLVEDAACLVFLETQYEELIDRLGDDKVAEAVRKTLKKMSPEAIAMAGEAVPGPRGLALLHRVVNGS